MVKALFVLSITYTYVNNMFIYTNLKAGKGSSYLWRKNYKDPLYSFSIEGRRCLEHA